MRLTLSDVATVCQRIQERRAIHTRATVEQRISQRRRKDFSLADWQRRYDLANR